MPPQARILQTLALLITASQLTRSIKFSIFPRHAATLERSSSRFANDSFTSQKNAAPHPGVSGLMELNKTQGEPRAQSMSLQTLAGMQRVSRPIRKQLALAAHEKFARPVEAHPRSWAGCIMEAPEGRDTAGTIQSAHPPEPPRAD